MTAHELLLLRHPQVSVRDVCYGHADVPAELVETELSALLDKLPRLDAVWTSPLSRCANLARRVADGQGVRLHHCDDLRELCFGAFEGLSWSEIEARFPTEYARWMRDWLRTPPPGGETLADFEARVERAVAAISEAHTEDARILIVTHAGVVRTLLRLTRSASWEEALAHPVPHMDPLLFRWPAPPPATAAPDRGTG